MVIWLLCLDHFGIELLQIPSSVLTHSITPVCVSGLPIITLVTVTHLSQLVNGDLVAMEGESEELRATNQHLRGELAHCIVAEKKNLGVDMKQWKKQREGEERK